MAVKPQKTEVTLASLQEQYTELNELAGQVQPLLQLARRVVEVLDSVPRVTHALETLQAGPTAVKRELAALHKEVEELIQRRDTLQADIAKGEHKVALTRDMITALQAEHRTTMETLAAETQRAEEQLVAVRAAYADVTSRLQQLAAQA